MRREVRRPGGCTTPEARGVRDRIKNLKSSDDENAPDLLWRIANSLRMTHKWITSDWSKRPPSNQLPPGLKEFDQFVDWLDK